MGWREAEYAKQLEQRLITLELLWKKRARFSLTSVDAKQTDCLLLEEECRFLFTLIGL